MTNPATAPPLVVLRTIRATPQQLFAAWTEPAQLKQWWGPRPVRCEGAEVDLRVGGRYRIGNRFPDGNVLWISGAFEAIDPPNKLVYSWGIEAQGSATERVTVTFVARGDSTEVIVSHERIANAAARAQHEGGWVGCLDGLVALFK